MYVRTDQFVTNEKKNGDYTGQFYTRIGSLCLDIDMKHFLYVSSETIVSVKPLNYHRASNAY